MLKITIDALKEEISTETAEKYFEEFTHSKSLYVWDDKEIVSMARKTRKTENGITISLVYTPPKCRNNGYALTCVHALTELLLTENVFYTLYTDLSNPISNSIYHQIGYEAVCDSIVINFVE